MNLAGQDWTIHPQPADWLLKNGDPRRMQVNAFGFGGSNYVVQIEQTMEHEDTADWNEARLTRVKSLQENRLRLRMAFPFLQRK